MSKAPSLAKSSISYVSEVPAQVSQAARDALAPFDPSWCVHERDPAGEGAEWMGHGFAGCLLPAEHWLEAHRALKDAGFRLLRDHTAVDYPDREPRFTVVTLPVNLDTQEELILKAQVADGEAIASLVPLWHSANWAERETFDMFGIPFEGHPDLTRIYMPQDYDGYPMRRDFPLQGHLRFQD